VSAVSHVRGSTIPTIRTLSIWGTVALVTAMALVAVTSSIAGQSNRAASDAFWQALSVEGASVESYEDLASMSESSDLVVRGHIRNIDLGRQFGELVPEWPNPEEGFVHYANATLVIDDVLGGPVAAAKGDSLVLELFLPSRDRLDILQDKSTGETGIYWLRNKGVTAAMLGKPRDVVRSETQFWRLISFEGVIRDFDGAAVPPIGADEMFVESIKDRSFTSVESATREVLAAE